MRFAFEGSTSRFTTGIAGRSPSRFHVVPPSLETNAPTSVAAARACGVCGRGCGRGEVAGARGGRGGAGGAGVAEWGVVAGAGSAGRGRVVAGPGVRGGGKDLGLVVVRGVVEKPGDSQPGSA